MTIDVREYVDLWRNDYIVYQASHFKGYGDLEKGISYFNAKYQNEISTMGSDALQGQINAITANMKPQARKAASGLKLFSELQSGSGLEAIMTDIEQGINEGIQKYKESVGFDNYEDIVDNAQGFSHALEHGHMSVTAVNDFFDLILQGAQQAGKFDLTLLDGLTGIGKVLSGDPNFSINASTYKVSKALTLEDIDMTQRIIDTLTRAATKLSKEGAVTFKSFNSTVNNIFATVMGERISRTLLAKGIQVAMGDMDSILYQMVKSGRLTYNKGSKFILGGSRKQKGGRTSKVDLFNSKAFTLTVQENGQQYDIEIGLNTSVKWYKGNNASNEIHLISGSPLGSYFRSGTEERYLAYNIITHRYSGKKNSDFHQAYRVLRAATAASFFNEWFTGSGKRITTKGGMSKSLVNKVQFLMVNGKVYSVMRIIRNICNDLARRSSWEESQNMPFNMSVQSSDQLNKWQGDKDSSFKEAMIRSAATNEVLNKLQISATLNGNILTQYAY